MRLTTLALLAALLLTWLPAAALAQETTTSQPAEPTLKVGDSAPALGPGKWLQGEPVSEFEAGKVYVLDFWATWCGPCIAAIPHITRIQEKYADKGVIVIGQNVAENDPAKLAPFMHGMGPEMRYRVVLDEPSGLEGQMAKTWLTAAGQGAIPCTMIVNQEGKLAWIGHPNQMEPVLEKIVAGTWDMEAAKIEAAKDRQVLALRQKIAESLRDGDVEGALRVVDEIGQVRPELAVQVPLVKFQILGQARRWDEAYTYVAKAIDEMTDPLVLNSLAWAIVDPASLLPRKDYDVALKAAAKADQLTEGKNGAIVDTLARCWFLKGDKQKAVELQKKAVELTAEGELKQRLIGRLREYEQVQ